MNQKIFIVTPWFDTFAGGAERAFRELAHAISAYSDNVIVLSTCSKSPYKHWYDEQSEPGVYQSDGIGVRKFPVDDCLKDYFAAVVEQSKGGELSEEIKSNFFCKSITSAAIIEHLKAELQDDDVVIGGPYFQGLIHNVAKAFPGRVTLVPALHDEEPFYWKPVQELIENCKNVIFLSNQEKELCVSTYGKFRGVDFQNWPVLGLPFKMESVKRKLDKKEPYVLYIGRFDKGKGLEKLIQWHLKANADREDKVVLKLIGAGDESFIPENPLVEVVGFVSEKEKRSLLSKALCLVNPSPNESFSYVLMEAAAAQIPSIVYSGCKVTHEHILWSDGGWGAASAEGYKAALSEALDLDLNVRKSQSAYNFVQKKYAPDVVINKYMEFLLS